MRLNKLILAVIRLVRKCAIIKEKAKHISELQR
jgi:hypothetical protein